MLELADQPQTAARHLFLEQAQVGALRPEDGGRKGCARCTGYSHDGPRWGPVVPAPSGERKGAVVVTETPGGAIVRLPAEGETTSLFGDTYAVKAAGEETGGTLAVIEAALAPRSGGTPLHVNTLEDENYYVIEGTLTFQLDESTLEAPAGTFVHIPKGMVHTHWNATDAPVKLLAFPAPAGFEKFFADLAGLMEKMPPGPPDMSRIGGVLREVRPTSGRAASEQQGLIQHASNPRRPVGTCPTDELGATAPHDSLLYACPRHRRREVRSVSPVTVELETMSITVDTEDIEWLQYHLANRPPDHESSALQEKLRDLLISPEPRTLALDEAEAGFVLVNLVGHDHLPARLVELRNGIEQES